MRISYDEVDDAMYIRFSEKEYFESEEIKEGVILDFDKEGKIIAMEVLDVSNRLPSSSFDVMNFEIRHPERVHVKL